MLEKELHLHMQLINETPHIQNQLEAMGLRRCSIELNLFLVESSSKTQPFFFLSHLCFHLSHMGKVRILKSFSSSMKINIHSD